MQKLALISSAICALTAGAAGAQDLMFTPGEDDRLSWAAYEAYAAQAPDLSGQTIAIGVGFEEFIKLEAVLDYFETATGATVTVELIKSGEIAENLRAGTNELDVMMIPQPGLLGDLAREGYVEPLGNDTADWVRDNFGAGQSWVDLTSFEVNGQTDIYALFYKASLKSLVWYVPSVFIEEGYQLPRSIEELKVLSNQMVRDGYTPWCIGIESGGASGWPATDWMEDLILRSQAPQFYDQWVQNEVPFNDPAVVSAMEEFGYFARNRRFVEGGGAGVAERNWADAVQGMFTEDKPECLMHRQASFITGRFPEGVQLGSDVHFFYLPSYRNSEYGNPILGAGDMISILKDSPASQALVEFFRQPISHEVWMAQGGFVSPHLGANPRAYSDDILRAQGGILVSAETFRFDGSDLMPGAIGAGAFWTGMVDFVLGTPALEVANGIEEAWQAIK